MATSSFETNIVIKTEEQANEFVTALEKAEKTSGKKVVMSRPVKEIRGDELKNIVRKIKVRA